MHPERFSFFWIIFVTLGILLDSYVLYNWQKFIKRYNYSKFWYLSMWLIAALVLAGSFYSSPLLLSLNTNVSNSRFFQIVAFLWYLPKILIAIVLLIKDIIRGISYIYSRIRILFQKILSKSKPEIIEVNIIEQPTPPNRQRREFIQKVAWTAAGTPFIIATNGMFRTAFDFETYHHNLPIKGLPSQLEGLRIVQISDIHSGSFASSKPMQEVRRIIENLQPDIILITGDFVNFQPEELNITFPELKKLTAPLGVYASIGNHDHYMSINSHELLKKGIRDSGINLLVNSNSIISVDGSKLNIAAIDNTGLGQKFGRIDEALQGLNKAYPTILMAHDPTFWDNEIRCKIPSVDVMLSGHTHGGQVGVHILGEDLSFARMVYKQWAGMYYDNNQVLYVNRGMGMVGPPIRIAIEPEITLFTLTQPENKG